MSAKQTAIEERLDKLISQFSNKDATAAPARDVARVVKRTEVATKQHKQSLVKYVVIGIAIILILAGIIYFMAKTKHGQGVQAKIAAMLPFGRGKRKAGPTNPTDLTKRPLIAEEVDFRSKRSNEAPSAPMAIPPSTNVVRVPNIPRPNIPVGQEPEDMDPGAIRLNLAGTPQPPQQSQPQPQQQQQPPIDPRIAAETGSHPQIPPQQLQPPQQQLSQEAQRDARAPPPPESP